MRTAKFKSTYASSGKYDPDSTGYKAYVKKTSAADADADADDADGNASPMLLNRTVCSANFRREPKNRKRAVTCSDLPGKGVYNHRFAYDEALKLHRKGVAVDVLYKVKNRTDSVYVINGEFLWTKSSPSSDDDNGAAGVPGRNRRAGSSSERQRSRQRTAAAAAAAAGATGAGGSDKRGEPAAGPPRKEMTDEELAWLEELARMQEEKKKKKSRQAEIALARRREAEREKREKYEEFVRKQKARESENDNRRRSERLRESLRAKRRRADGGPGKDPAGENAGRADGEGGAENADNMAAGQNDLERLEFQRNLATVYKNNMNNRNVISDKLDANPANAFGGNEVRRLG